MNISSYLGDAEWILGMKITRDRQSMKTMIDQEQYILGMLKDFGMEQCCETSVPSTTERLSTINQPQTEKEKEEMSYKPYRSMVGYLVYASVATRPDITYAVNVCSRFNTNPGIKHWNAAKYILRYLRGTSTVGLTFVASKEKNITIAAFSDSDWAGDQDDRKSTSGYIIKINNNIVSWVSKKQKTVADSSAEAEYYALTETAKELKWFKSLFEEIGCIVNQPSIIYCDNRAATILTENDVFHGRTKHIEIKYHFIRDMVIKNELRVEWISTINQEADILTKPLGRNIFERLKNRFMKLQLNQQ